MARNTVGVVQVEDYDGEISSTSFNLQNIDQTGSNYGSVTQDLDELKDAILGVIVGQVRFSEVMKRFPESAAEVTDQSAQRERKWLVVMRDTLQYLDVANAISNPGFQKLFTLEIACADPSLLVAHSDLMDVSAGAGLTLHDGLEANARSPWNNNPEATITPTQEVVEVRLVGRNT